MKITSTPRAALAAILAASLLAPSPALAAYMVAPQGASQAVLATSPALSTPALKEIARKLVSSAENSSLDWQAQYGYIEYNVEGNPTDNRGYTGGIIGFTSKTHDMLLLVKRYAKLAPRSALARYLPALTKVDGTSSSAGLGSGFVKAWQAAGKDPLFQKAQRDLSDEMYFNPAVGRARLDGLGALGQFIYYDAIVVHGPGDAATDFGGIRRTAMLSAKTPAEGGNEKVYLNAFLDARVKAMKSEESHTDVTRVETAQRVFLNQGKLGLELPLRWKVYGDSYVILPTRPKR